MDVRPSRAQRSRGPDVRLDWRTGLLVLGLGLLVGGGQAVSAPRRRRRDPVGPRIEPVRGHWSAIADPAERLRTYARDLLEAYRASGLPEIALPLAVAHSMFATGAWKNRGPYVWNNNIAVVRAGATWRGPWYAKDTVEVTDDRGTVDPSDDVLVVDRGAAWRAYASLADGAAAAIRIWCQPRYRAAYQLLVAGDASWSRVLGEHGYYSANPVHFERQYRNRLQRVRALLAQGERA